MLDLAKEKKWYEIKWFNGIVLKLPILSQQEVNNELGYVYELLDSPETEKKIDGLMAFIKELINRNKDGIVLTDEDYKDLDLDLMTMIIEDYTNFIETILGE